MAFIDHPANHAAQRRQQIARLRRRARLHLRLDDLTCQHPKRLLAILGQERLDQAGMLEPRRVRQTWLADGKVAQPMVAVFVKRQYQRRV